MEDLADTANTRYFIYVIITTRRITMKQYTIVAITLLVCTAFLPAQDLSNYPMSLSPASAINTSSNDYAPALSPNKDFLYFTSTRGGGVGKADVYGAYKKGNVWDTPSAIPSINTPSHEGAFSFTADGKIVVFAAERSDGLGDADIYIADFSNGTISNIRNLGADVNSKYWDSQPAITSDGTAIYFSSKRKDGIGGCDIWVTRKSTGGTWAKAQCLDKNINTTKDDRSPFVTTDGGTLVFASKGHAGFGGFDLFYSSRDGNTWSTPTNLGGIVNSENDELFFNAPAVGDYFYIASSRNPENGLDIFQGTPNLLGLGTMRLLVSVTDSLTGKPLPSTVIVYDVAANVPVATIVTTGDIPESSVALPANRNYRLEARVQGYPARSADVTSTTANGTQRVRIQYGTIGFDFSNYQIPFFVTGYYRPNTSKNLEDLFELRKGDLSDATYIENFDRNSPQHQKYVSYSKVVDDLFTSVVTTAVDTIFPRFLKNSAPDEIIEISVYGFADPKPILGRYVETETVYFEDANGTAQTVKPNDKLTNLKLSGLRAYHSSKQIERQFEDLSAQRGFDDYKQLVQQGKIKYRYIGGGVNTSGNDFAAQRRIKIDFVRIKGTTKNNEYDTNKVK